MDPLAPPDDIGSRELRPDSSTFDHDRVASYGHPCGGSDDLSGPHVEPRAVQRTGDDELVQPALAKGTARVGARVVETVDSPFRLEQSVWFLIHGYALRRPVQEIGLPSHLGAHGRQEVLG